MINQHFNWNLSWCGLLCFGIRILCSVSVLCNKSGSHWKHKLWAACAPKDLLSPISSYILRQLFDKIENFPGFLPFLKFDMSCVEKKIFEMCPDVTSITQVFKYATQICAANSTYNLMNGPPTKIPTPTKTLIFSRKIVLFWKPFSGFCCTLKTANNEPIHFKLAVNHTGDSSIKWPMKVEHFLLHFKEIKYAKKNNQF